MKKQEFADVDTTQVVGENEYYEKVQKEKEELKNSNTLVVENSGNTEKLDNSFEDNKEEIKKSEEKLSNKIPNIDKAKWTISVNLSNNSHNASNSPDAYIIILKQ